MVVIVIVVVIIFSIVMMSKVVSSVTRTIAIDTELRVWAVTVMLIM